MSEAKQRRAGNKVGRRFMSDFPARRFARSRAPALERTVLEAPASRANLARQVPREQCVPRQEPRNKDINPHHVKYKLGTTWPLSLAVINSWKLRRARCHIVLQSRTIRYPCWSHSEFVERHRRSDIVAVCQYISLLVSCRFVRRIEGVQ